MTLPPATPSSAASTPAPGPGSSAEGRTLTDDLRALQAMAEQGPLNFGQIVDALHERAGISLLVILSLAFLFVPIPGVSTASSVLFVALAVTAVFGTKVWMPGFVRRGSISQENAKKMLGLAERMWGRISKLVKPRLTVLTKGPFRWLVGVSLMTAIVAFALPIPIPFNNSPPSFCILLLSLGLLGRDGVMVIAGHIANAVLWLVLFLAGDFMWNLLRKVADKFAAVEPLTGALC